VRDSDVLRDDLRRWSAAGLITDEQARAIEAAESARVAAAAPPATGRGRVPLVVEALGYVGGVLAVVAGFIAARELWPDMPRGAQEGFALAGCVVLLLGGAALRSSDEPAFRRLHSVLWTASAACLAAFVALYGDGETDDDTALVLAVALVAAAYLLLLQGWQPSGGPAVALSVALAVACAAAAHATGHEKSWEVGLTVWAFSLLWFGLAGQLRPLRPVSALQLSGVAGALVGAQLTMSRDLGHLLAAATVAAVIVAGVALERTELLALGTFGLLVAAPQTATRFLPDSVGAPVAVFLVGAGLIAVAVWLARRPGRR
jgi:hypothetical protein